MSSQSQSLYKSRKVPGESTTISRRERRLSQNLKRRKARDDELNKRRVLLVETSPIVEEVKAKAQQEERKTVGGRGAQISRLERLEKWREERKKRKVAEEKEKSKKPMFKVSRMTYSNDHGLYKSTDFKAPNGKVTKTSGTDKKKNDVWPSTITSQARGESKEGKSLKTKCSTAIQRRKSNRNLSPTNNLMSTAEVISGNCKERNEISSVSSNVQSAVGNTPKVKRTATPRRKSKRNLSPTNNPMSAAEVISSDYEERNIVSSVSSNVQTAAGNAPKMKRAATPRRKSKRNHSLTNNPMSAAEVISSDYEERNEISSVSSNVQSAVGNTPKMKRTATPRRKSKRNLSPTNNPMSAAEVISSDYEERNIVSSVSSNVQSAVGNIPKVKRTATPRRKSKGNLSPTNNPMSAAEVISGDSEETDEASSEYRSRNVQSTVVPKRKSSRLINVDCSHVDAPSPAKKKLRTTNIENYAEVIDREEEEDFPPVCQEVVDTQIKLEEDKVTPLSEQRAKMSAVIAKRNSLQLTCNSESSIESKKPVNDAEKVLSSLKKRESMSRRRSRRSHNKLSSGKRRSRSVVVSVSDEGTAGMEGENVIGDIKSADTPIAVPKHENLQRTTPSRSNLRRSSRRSTVVSVSNEGTSVGEELCISPAVYQIEKPPMSDKASRILRELVVEKVDGEISFIEVPSDEIAYKMSTPKVKLTASSVGEGFSTQVASDESSCKLSSKETFFGSSDGEGFSTQPFTPTLSAENSRIRRKSQQNSAKEQPNGDSTSTSTGTPKVRGRSMTPLSTFKEPGQPASALRKSGRRRKTERASPRTPEEMIEILKTSPMVEMSRRRSRNLTSPVMQQVKHFRNLLKSETARLNAICDQWRESTSWNLSEEVEGQIRSAIGKAELLIAQRFKQFSGLVDDCEFKRGEKETTASDLQGFWDMIYFQVEDVDSLFKELIELKNNNWQVKPSPVKLAPKKRPVMKASLKPKVKSNFAAFRKDMKRMMAAKSQPSEMVSEEGDSQTKTFDAGFFKVSSPIRSEGRSRKSNSNSSKPSDCRGELTQGFNGEATKSSVELSKSRSSVTECESHELTTTSLKNKENEQSTPRKSHPLPMLAKRLSYLPAVPSPLLNDITSQNDQTSK